MCRSRHERGHSLLFLTVAALASAPPRATAQLPPAAEPVVEQGTVYLLDVRVNGWPLGLVARFRDEDGRLSLPAEQFDGLGFKLDESYVTVVGPERRVYLDQVPGFKWQVDMRAQTIDITTPFERLKTTELQIAPGVPKVESRSDWGGLLYYDIFGEWSARPNDPAFSRSLSANVDARLFSPWFTASTTGYYTYQQGGESDFVRLDSVIDIDDPEKIWRLRLGDSYTTGPVWVRAIRFGGVQFMRDFSLRPDIVTTPVPVLSQDVSLPSTVDLFINGVQRYSQPVNPGAIRLTDLPVSAGANNVRVVVTDRAGRRTELILPLYSSSLLLAKGMSSFNLEAGVARRNYSFQSNDYRGKFVSGSISHGVTDGLTLRAYAAGAGDYWTVAGGATVSIGDLFVLDAALLYSDTPQESGWAYYVGVERTSRVVSISARYGREFGFHDLATQFGYATFTEKALGSFGLNLGRAGQINLTYAMQRQREREITSVASATYGIDVFRNKLHLSASGYADTHGDNWGVTFSLSFPLGRVGQVYAQGGWRNGKRSSLVQLRGEAFDQRLIWEVEGQEGEFGGVAAQADWDGQKADLHFRAARSGDSTGFQAELMQSLVFMDNQLFLAGRVDDAFTVVDVEKTPGVRVALENRTVGRTNEQGRIFISGLQSYAPNAVSIEPLDLPVDASIGDTSTLVAPREGAGVVTNFQVKRARAAVITLQLPDGSPPPAGASVAGAEEPALMGYGGETYVRGLKTGANRLDVTWNGGSCSASFTADVARGTLPRLGPFTCAP